jgi:hypothetical protein
MAIRVRVEELKRFAEPFEGSHAVLDFGRKRYEALVAEALAKGTFHSNGLAAAVVRRAAQASTRRSFTSHRIPIARA